MAVSEAQAFVDRVADAARVVLGTDGELCAWQVGTRLGADGRPEVALGMWWGGRVARITWTWSGIRNDREAVYARRQIEELAETIRGGE